MAELRWTNEALDWLLEKIYNYIALDKPGVAAKVIDGIFDKAKLLTAFPDMGTRLRRVPEGEIRMIQYGHYRIAYLRQERTEVI